MAVPTHEIRIHRVYEGNDEEEARYRVLDAPAHSANEPRYMLHSEVEALLTTLMGQGGAARDLRELIDTGDFREFF